MATPLRRVPPPVPIAINDPTFNRWLHDLTAFLAEGGGIDPGAIPGYDTLVSTVDLHTTQISSNTIDIAANTSDIATKVDRVGDIMTGPLILNADPVIPLGAVTKQYSDLKAPIASPIFTGDPKAPTPATADNDTSIATTEFVKAQNYLTAVPASYAPIVSPTFTGDPKAPTPIAGDNDTSIATTAFVLTNAAPIANPSANLIINGDMAISQENGSTTIAPVNNASRYLADQWNCGIVQAANTAVWAASVTGPVTLIPGIGYQLGLTVTTAWSAGNANDYVRIFQPIEGQRWAKLGWGTANALPVSIGFWIYATITGICALSIQNAAGNRNYVTPISITVAATWQYKTVTIPGDVTGTWPTDNNQALLLTLCFGSGATYTTPNTNVWQTGNLLAQTGITNFFATNGNGVYITGVSLIPGNTPVPLAQSAAIRRSPAEELVLCRRYWKTNPPVAGHWFETDATSAMFFITHNPPMRTPATVAIRTTAAAILRPGINTYNIAPSPIAGYANDILGTVLVVNTATAAINVPAQLISSAVTFNARL